ncbi:MAG: peptidyl-prolyl cis-trans isomerase, partial [Deltaproteobacteria bacterium]|nr:peptidyl-prolyl cis-trans isomerase [Deltaproteobacteria bacterium]
WLSKMNLTESDARSELGNEIAIQQFIDTQVGMNITVSDEEAKTFYDTHQDLFKQPPQVKASHILIKTDAQADQKQKDEALNKIKEIKNKLTNGGDFATLAKEFSGCPSSASGGDLGYFGQGQMVKPFEDAAFALQTGETSNIVETVFGYHLIKVTDKKPATVIPYQDVQQTLKENLKREKTNREVGAYLEKLRGAATIDRLLPTN